MSPAELSQEARELLDDAACGLIQTADDGTLLRANRTFCQWLGLSTAALIGQRRFQDLLTMGGRIFHQTHWAPLLRMQGSISEVKLELVHADGSKIPMVLNAIRRPQAGATVHEIAAYVAHDRDKYERELLRSRERLQHLVAEATRHEAEAKDRAVFAEQMIGIVSHDLRNPLTVIQLAATVVSRREHLSERASADIQRILKAVDRATRLVRDLLDFTKARLGGGITIDPRPTDLHALVRGVKDETELAFPDRRVELRQEGDTHGDWDPDRIVQIVENLLTNALKYSPADTTVQLLTRADATTVSLHVHNAGPAITAPQLHRLFEPLQRAAEHDDRTTRSVGLGLYIVKQLVEAHGGAITVDSSEVDGTTVTVTLPRHSRVA